MESVDTKLIGGIMCLGCWEHDLGSESELGINSSLLCAVGELRRGLLPNGNHCLIASGMCTLAGSCTSSHWAAILPHIHAELRLLLSLRREGKSEGWFCFWSWKYDHSNCYYALAHQWFLLCRFYMQMSEEYQLHLRFSVLFISTIMFQWRNSGVYKWQNIYSSLM